MKRLSFQLKDSVFESEDFEGGVMVQVSSATENKPSRIGLETRIDPEAGWFNMRSIMLTGNTTVFAITEYAQDQRFRLTSRSKINAVISEMGSTGTGAATAAELQRLSARVDDLADGQEPLVLNINEETGNLEQTGISSGEFGIEETTGNLTYEPQ